MQQIRFSIFTACCKKTTTVLPHDTQLKEKKKHNSSLLKPRFSYRKFSSFTLNEDFWDQIYVISVSQKPSDQQLDFIKLQDVWKTNLLFSVTPTSSLWSHWIHSCVWGSINLRVIDQWTKFLLHQRSWCGSVSKEGLRFIHRTEIISV